jgi:hypothetical protein
MSERPGVLCHSIHVIKGLPVHQKLGSIGLSYHHSSRSAQAIHTDRVFGSPVGHAGGMTTNSGLPSHVQRIFDGDGNPRERPLNGNIWRMGLPEFCGADLPLIERTAHLGNGPKAKFSQTYRLD